jgi:hypothetical protein
MSWYVLYKERAVNALQRLDDRDSALSTAFALAHGGHELIELGRIGGPGGEAIAGPAMARLLADYARGAPQWPGVNQLTSLAPPCSP